VNSLTKIETLDSAGSAGTSDVQSEYTRWTSNKPSGAVASRDPLLSTYAWIDWDDFVSDGTAASFYRIYRNPGNADDIGGVHSFATTTESFLFDGPLTPGVTYKYWIMAKNNQAYSLPAEVTYTVPGGG
jgi:hypothetical protein